MYLLQRSFKTASRTLSDICFKKISEMTRILSYDPINRRCLTGYSSWSPWRDNDHNNILSIYLIGATASDLIEFQDAWYNLYEQLSREHLPFLDRVLKLVDLVMVAGTYADRKADLYTLKGLFGNDCYLPSLWRRILDTDIFFTRFLNLLYST